MKNSHRSFALFLVFAGLGLAGNNLPVPLFFGLDFLSGNIFVFLALALLGTRAGTGVAAIAGAATYFLWGNPYAWLGMVVQAVLVGVAIRYKRPAQMPRNMPAWVASYWLLVGLPLIACLYHYVLGLDWQAALMVGFKQAVNDVSNALVAALALSYLPLRRWCGLPKVERGISLRGMQTNLLAAFAFFPSLVVISLLSRSDVSAMEAAAKSRLAVRSAALSQHAREWADEHLQVAQVLAGQVDMGRGLTDASLHRDLRLHASASSEVVAIRLVDVSGQVVWASNALRGAGGEDVSKRDWFRRMLTRGAPVMALRVWGGGLDEPVVVFAAPILQRTGDVVGAVALSYSLRSFENMFSAKVLEDRMRATLVDRDNKVIVSSEPDFVPNQVFETQRGGAEVERLGEVYRWRPDGVRSTIEAWTSSYYVRHADVGDSGWQLVVELPLKAHFVAMQHKVLQGFMAIFALALTAFLVGGWLGRRIVRPLKALGLVTAHLAQNISDEKIAFQYHGLSEIDALVDNFRGMASSLRRTYGELIAVHRDLEQRVAERTADLVQQTEALQQARDTAEAASRAKTQFLSSMSHEMRTPMNAILGFSQYLQMEALSDDQKMGVDEIYKAGMHLLALIDEVLNLAKIEAGQMHLSLEPVELAPLVAECLPLVNSLAAKRGIRISYSGLEGRVVRADRVRLKQVVLNLLSNAIKYNRDRGSVDLTVGARDAESLQIRVKDSGRGIPAARLHELFQPFQRLGAENGPIEGTGIGLTITRRMVELMGGTVDVESQEGVGSTFWIELPLAVVASPSLEAGSAAADQALPPDAAAGQHTVLYIEDNPANLKLVGRILGRRKDIQLLTAHTPELGIELARMRRPELILLDINLPGMDGYQVLKIFQADATLQDIPVVAVTANALPRDVESGLAAGFTGYLTKPLNIPHFNEVVDALLGDAPPSRAADQAPPAVNRVPTEAAQAPASTGADNWATF